MSAPTTVPASIRTRVEAGAAWLDQHQPDWLDRIDLILLDLHKCSRCVLGQLYGDYNDSPLGDGDDVEAARLGFFAEAELADHATNADVEREYAELTEGWREYVLDQAQRTREACDGG